MKLLNTTTFKIVEYYGRDVPPYAILSHTWVQNEEVSYQDIVNENWRESTGYHKIKNCCSQALRDGLDWAWIDTCSIDKTSSAELSEAINSMFRYYSQATACYAYLADVTIPSKTASSSSQPLKTATLIHSFKNSKWFTRGWTLQELLAPSKLTFYTASWESIGDRTDWKDEISHTTSIDISVLTSDGSDFSQFSIAERMSWAASRVTTREEDMAYSLLGIFGVHMPLLYGEGENAFFPLQEEIMKISDDQSIFAWRDVDSDSHGQYTGLLSPSISQFRGSKMRPVQAQKESRPYSMTNAGLQITGIIRHNPSRWEDVHILCLPVYDRSDPNLVVGIPLIRLTEFGDQYTRKYGQLVTFPTSELQQLSNIALTTIYVRKEIAKSASHIPNSGQKAQFRLQIYTNQHVKTYFERVYPTRQVFFLPLSTLGIRAPKTGDIASHLDGWSWHVAIILRFEIDWTDASARFGTSSEKSIPVPVISLSETCRCVLYVGFNGRTGSAWCALKELSDELSINMAQRAWKQIPNYTSEDKASWTFWRHDSDETAHSRTVGVEVLATLETRTRQTTTTQENERASYDRGYSLGFIHIQTRRFASDGRIRSGERLKVPIGREEQTRYENPGVSPA